MPLNSTACARGAAVGVAADPHALLDAGPELREVARALRLQRELSSSQPVGVTDPTGSGGAQARASGGRREGGGVGEGQHALDGDRGVGGRHVSAAQRRRALSCGARIPATTRRSRRRSSPRPRGLGAAAVPAHVRHCIDGARRARHAREQEWRPVSIELPYLPPDVATSDRLQPQPPWPGGVAQQHRNGLRPVADELLRGYDAEFAGLIEVGTGVWRCGPSMTAVSHVSWANFRAYAKLRAGEFGEAPTRSDHTILLLNPSSRLSVANIGQPWDVDLRREAARLLEPPPILLYAARVVTRPAAPSPSRSPPTAGGKRMRAEVVRVYGSIFAARGRGRRCGLCCRTTADEAGRRAAAPGSARCVVLEVRRTAPSLTLKSLTVRRPRRRARAVVGQRHGRAPVVCNSKVFLSVPSRSHTRTGVVAAAEDALAVRRRRHRENGVDVPGAGAHKALGGDAPHLDELVRRAAGDVLAVGHHHQRGRPLGVPLEGVDERPVDVVRQDLAVEKADHEVHAVGQRRCSTRRRHLEGALESAVERPQLRGRRRDADERAPPGSTATATTHRAPGWCARTRRRATQRRRSSIGDDAAVEPPPRTTASVCPASVDLGEAGRSLCDLRGVVGAWHAAPCSDIVGERRLVEQAQGVRRQPVSWRASAGAASPGARVVGIAASARRRVAQLASARSRRRAPQ